MNLKILMTSAAVLILMSPAGFAQDEKKCLGGTDFSLDDECLSESDVLGVLDLSTPENALFSLLGSAPETVIKPKVGDKISASILPQVADAFGNEQYSIGVEINPGLLMMPDDYTIAELISSSGGSVNTERADRLNQARLWSQFTFSAAATKSSDGGNKTSYGMGANYIHDSGSPFNATAQKEYGNCIRDAYTDPTTGDLLSPSDALAVLEGEVAAETKTDGTPAFSTVDEIEAEAEKRFKSDPRFGVQRQDADPILTRCIASASPWNRTVYGAGVAVVRTEADAPSSSGDAMMMTTMTASTEDLEKTGAALWASYAGPSPLDNENGQIAASIRYSDNLARQRKDGDMTINETVDAWQIGGRYTHSFDDTKDSSGATTRSFRGFIEIAYAEEEFGDINDSYSQAGVGFEIQLQKNLYFQAVFGDTFGSEIDRDTYLSGQIKWSFSTARAS